jgi:hypothetical protein
MVTVCVFPIQGKTHTVEPGIDPGTSWLVARHSDKNVESIPNIIQLPSYTHFYILIQSPTMVAHCGAGNCNLLQTKCYFYNEFQLCGGVFSLSAFTGQYGMSQVKTVERIIATKTWKGGRIFAWLYFYE